MKYRTIFLSDIHLGSKLCNSKSLLEFLKNNDSEYLILIGDIIDFWSLKRNSYWPQEHNTIIQKILKKSRHGTKVIFIPGNHDEALREYLGFSFGDITIYEEFIHTLKNRQTILCLHGDKFDIVTQYHKWLAFIGDVGYNILVDLNKLQNNLRTLFNLKQWSLSSYIKHNVKEVVSFIGDYEENVLNEAKKINVTGIFCGHIHHPELEIKEGIIYGNTGDFCETCSGIIETLEGNLEMFHWTNNEYVKMKEIICN